MEHLKNIFKKCIISKKKITIDVVPWRPGEDVTNYARV